jgi:hypothetical protein
VQRGDHLPGLELQVTARSEMHWVPNVGVQLR